MIGSNFYSACKLWYDSVIQIDFRHLALLRILLGFTCCLDILRRVPQIELFYSNQGLYSNHFALFSESARVFSLLFAFSHPAEVSLFFLVTFYFALCLVIGWRTRLSAFMTWILMTSIVNRNLTCIYGGDTVMLNLLLIAQFLPLGNVWSFDARRSQDTQVGGSFRSLAVALLFLQLAAIYFFAGIHKNGPTWMEGLGVYYPLFQDRVVTALGVWVRENVSISVLKVMSHLSLIIEIGCPFLILAPYKSAFCRRVAFYILLLFQLSILLLLNLGLFQVFMIVHSIILLSNREIAWIENIFVSCGSLFRKVNIFQSQAHIQTSQVLTIRKRGLHLLRELSLLMLLVIFVTDIVSSNAFFRDWEIIRPKWVSYFVAYTSFRQSWGMFSPDVPQHDFYLVFDALLDDQTHVNMMTGKKVDLSALRYGAQAWNEQIDSIARLFHGKGSRNMLEIERWLRERRAGLIVPEGRKVIGITVWTVTDRTPRPEERHLIEPLDVTVTKELELSNL
jgi:uncharacterized membrane protein YphA (DoxX/SURF4 family)